jgi:hypothetical protein
LYITLRGFERIGFLILGFTICICLIWYMRKRQTDETKGKLWHALLHVFSVITVHIYLSSPVFI